MLLKNEELISRYFERRMTPGEEQNFLISLAASDEMRLAFRSHLELMKVVRQDKDSLRQVAQVRTRTFAALGLASPAIDHFLEQSLLKQKSEAPAEAPLDAEIPVGTSVVNQASVQAPSALSRMGSFLRNRAVTAALGLIVGVTGAALYTNTHETAPASTQAVQNSQPTSTLPEASQTPAQSVAAPAQSTISSETIAQPNALDKKQHAAENAAENRSRETTAVKSGSVASNNTTSRVSPKSDATSRLNDPEITRQNKARISVKSRIEKPGTSKTSE